MKKTNPSYALRNSWQKGQTTYEKPVMGDPLAVIYNEGFWRVNKVSPLYNLEYNDIKLKQYASKIRQSVVSNVSTTSTKYSVQFEAQPYLKYCEEDADGLMIQVTSCSENNNNNLKVVYTAILLSWGVKSYMDNATHLLCMLERGEQRLGTAVKAALQNTFDCTIKGFHFTQTQLLYLGFSFVENGSPRCNDPFTLCYTDPQSELREKLTLTCNAGDMLVVWNRVTDEVSTSREQVKWAYQILKTQFFHMIGMDITKFELLDVKLPQAEIKYNGVVKMKTPELVNCVLTILNEISSDLVISSDASVSSSSS
ncbi:hypothetical protein K1T71_010312 [Dendrolimus kikuchii]|uniref:Uncharacterized protein n=1 Tax=Dendrolimus kikuchii TaxID=765133 RepID=A0ACC1CR86_9NEOP|nr:hypothetical protein K1T71_010312 [Dendrolimus kikuchii]